MSLLTQLRGYGLTVSVSGQTLRVEPGSSLTSEIRNTIRANKATILRELEQEVRAEHEAPVESDDLGGPTDFREALIQGRLVICANCSRFKPGDLPAALGHCRWFNVETWPCVPFSCTRFAATAAPQTLSRFNCIKKFPIGKA